VLFRARLLSISGCVFRPWRGAQAAVDYLAHQHRFVGFRKNLRNGFFDVLVGHAALAKLAGDAVASLTADINASAREVQRVAGVVDHFFLPEARKYPLRSGGIFRATLEIHAHFVNRMGAAHQRAESGGVEGLVGRQHAAFNMHAGVQHNWSSA
jgi:hypothetical protein